MILSYSTAPYSKPNPSPATTPSASPSTIPSLNSSSSTNQTPPRPCTRPTSSTAASAPRGSSLDLALAVFKKFFQTKTGLRWEERYDESKTPGPKRDAGGQPLPADEGWFRFEWPTGLLGRLRVAAERETEKQITASQANDACAIARCDDMEIVATTMTEDCDSDTDNDHREPTQYCRFQCPASVDSDDDDDGDGSSTANAADAETGSSQLI